MAARLPLRVLDAAQPHQPMLERLGCRHLGQVRALPRKALAQRFGPELLDALDQAYDPAVDAQQPQTWEVVPETFSAQIELPWRVEQAQALLVHAQPLLQQLSAWLAARHQGVLRLTLAWATVGTLALIALVINSIRRQDDPNPLHRAHHRYMIRTFWWSLVWLVLSLPLFFLYVLPGLLAYAVVGIWYLYRSLKGWMRFADSRFPDNPPVDVP